MKWRARIEASFESWGHFVFRHAKLVLAFVLLTTTGLVSQLHTITVDTSSESFLYKDDPIRVAYDEFREQFGRDEVIVIGLNPPDIFDPAFLRELEQLHKELEAEVPYLDEVNSLINARSTRGEGDTLIVEDLFEHWPETEEALAELRTRTMANPVYRNLLVSEDGTYTSIVIETMAFGEATETISEEDAAFAELQTEEGPAQQKKFLMGAESDAAVMKVKEILARHADGPVEMGIYLAGTPVLTASLTEIMRGDLQVLLLLSLLAISVCLYVAFRSWVGVVLPMMTVVLSMLCTLSLMAIFRVPIQLATQILPTFLLAVGIGNSVHILAVFFQRHSQLQDKEEAIAKTLGHSGLAVGFTSLTTAAGLGAFMTADMYPVAMLGLFAVIGITSAFCFSVILLPAFLAVSKIKLRAPIEDGKGQLTDRALRALGDFALTHPWKIVSTSMVLFGIAIWAALQLPFAHDPISWYPEDDPIRTSFELMDEKLRGTVALELEIDTGEENGLHDPTTLRMLEELASELETIKTDTIFVGKTLSIVEISKEIHQALNGNYPSYYRLPETRPLIAQELLLFENSGSDDLEDLVDSQFRLARLTVKVPWADSIDLGIFLTVVDPVLQRFEEKYDVKIDTNGLLALMGRTVDVLIFSLRDSYFIAFMAITPMMMLMLGSVRRGLVSMIPNLTPIVFTLGMMYVLSIPVDAFTLLIGATALGLAVDDTIHFMHNFGRYYEESQDVRYAVHETLHTTGRAMLFTTVILSTGFFIYTISVMENLFNFGFLTGVAILLAFLADAILAPALMLLMVRHVYKDTKY